MAGGVPVSLVPLLVVELLIMVVSRVDREVLGDPGGEFNLLVDLVQEQVVFLAHHAVTVGTVFAEDLETYIKSTH